MLDQFAEWELANGYGVNPLTDPAPPPIVVPYLDIQVGPDPIAVADLPNVPAVVNIPTGIQCSVCGEDFGQDYALYQDHMASEHYGPIVTVVLPTTGPPVVTVSPVVAPTPKVKPIVGAGVNAGTVSTVAAAKVDPNNKANFPYGILPIAGASYAGWKVGDPSPSQGFFDYAKNPGGIVPDDWSTENRNVDGSLKPVGVKQTTKTTTTASKNGMILGIAALGVVALLAMSQKGK